MKAFLERLETISDSQIDAFIKEIDKRQKKGLLGEQIITIVEQADSKEKSKLLGIIFQMYLEKSIEKSDFDFLTFCVNKAFIEDIYSLDPYHNLKGRLQRREDELQIDQEQGQPLYSLGLVNMEIIQVENVIHPDDSSMDRLQTKFTLNHWGKLLREAVKLFNDQEIECPQKAVEIK